MQPTSVIARDRHEASGASQRNRTILLRLVREYPGETAVELWSRCMTAMSRHEVSRRLPELRAAELVRNGTPRKCRVSTSRSSQMTWLPVEATE